MILDPLFIQPADNYNYTISIHGTEYVVDAQLYKLLNDLEADENLFFVKAKNRKERKFFEKKKIYKFDIWFVMTKSDLDSYYIKF